MATTPRRSPPQNQHRRPRAASGRLVRSSRSGQPLGPLRPYILAPPLLRLSPALQAQLCRAGTAQLAPLHAPLRAPPRPHHRHHHLRQKCRYEYQVSRIPTGGTRAGAAGVRFKGFMSSGHERLGLVGCCPRRRPARVDRARTRRRGGLHPLNQSVELVDSTPCKQSHTRRGLHGVGLNCEASRRQAFATIWVFSDESIISH